VLIITVPDLHALRAPYIDCKLPCPCPGLIDQAHQGLGCRCQSGIMASVGLIQFCRQRRAPGIRSLFTPGQHELAIWPAVKPPFTRAFSPE
jgi:hypothetical protein